MTERQNNHPISIQERQRLILNNSIFLVVRAKMSVEKGTTPYYFSYSFKGEQEGHPIVPNDLQSVARDLSLRLKKNNQTIIALDRGGTALGVALSIETRLPLYIAFSYGQPRDNGIFWEEPGGGKFLGIPRLNEGSHVILVDDEINSGATLANAVKTLKNNHISTDQALVVAETDKKDHPGRLLLEQFGCPLESLYQIPEPVFDQEIGDYVFPNKP